MRYGPNQFTGELGPVDGRRATLVDRGRCGLGGLLARSGRSSCASIVVQDRRRLGGLILDAYVTRRSMLLSSRTRARRSSARATRRARCDCRSSSPATHPHNYLDVERDPSVQALLDQLPRRHRRGADRILPRRARAAQPEQRPAGGVPRLHPGARRGGGATCSSSVPARRASPPRSTVRPRDWTWWCWRPTRPAARPGPQLADRELPRLPDGALRRGAGRARVRPGGEVRRPYIVPAWSTGSRCPTACTSSPRPTARLCRARR